MEWWKLFSGTFILIFLAELGDKTQLAALAKTADSPDDSTAKWVVFLGASAALVASTFVAVFLGHLLKALIPDERYIKLAAGALFLVFGGMILYEVARSSRDTDSVPVPAPADGGTDTPRPGFLGGLTLKAAQDFEAHTARRYRDLAAAAGPDLAALLLDLAREEDGHLASLHGLAGTAGPERDRRGPTRTYGGEAVTLADCIRLEESAATWYRELAERTLIPSARTVLLRLAAEEESHAQRLRAAAAGRATEGDGAHGNGDAQEHGMA